jgi:transcriptional regulator
MARDKTDLLQGTLELIILRLLRAGPQNGWDVTLAIQSVSRGILDVNYGSVYPALRRLEAQGLARGKWGTSDNNRRARYYELTPKGLRQLGEERAAWTQFATAMRLILAED